MQTNGMEKVYSKIANELNAMIPTSWIQLYLHAEIESDSVESYFYFQNEKDERYIYGLDIPGKYNVSREVCIEQLLLINDYVEELYNEFRINKQSLWSNMTFFLNSQGKFDIKYDYSNLSESRFDDYERQVIWKYNTLHEVPNENNLYDKKIIEAYLNSQDESY